MVALYGNITNFEVTGIINNAKYDCITNKL